MANRSIQQSARSPDARDTAVGPRIRAARHKQKVSQGALADKLGITFQQIQKYENGKNRVTMGRLSNIAEILGVTATFLLAGAEEEHGARADNECESFLEREGALRLLKAYNRMDHDTRQAVVALVESIAGV